jgi:hypothetical protein
MVRHSNPIFLFTPTGEKGEQNTTTFYIIFLRLAKYTKRRTFRSETTTLAGFEPEAPLSEAAVLAKCDTRPLILTKY